MKWKWLLAFGLWAILTGGCIRSLHDPPDAVRVVVEGGGEFPASLAGRWVAQQHGWELEFEPDGRISATVLSLGRVRVVPGRTTTRPTKSGAQAVFTPGRWTVHYLPSTEVLTVCITMDHIRVEMGVNILEGSSTDTFVGPVDLAKHTWQTQWTTFTRYTAHTPDAGAIDLSTDPTDGETQALTFTKAPDLPP